MPEGAVPVRLENSAAELVGQIIEFVFKDPIGQLERVLPGISGAVDLAAIREAFGTEVAKRIRDQIAKGTEATLLEALRTDKRLREFLQRGGLNVRSTLEDVRALMGKNVIGPEAYMNAFKVTSVGEVTELPVSLTLELLNSRCPIANDGRFIKDTHRLVFIPATIDDGPLTLNSLRELTRKATEGRDPSFYSQDWYDKEAFANTPLDEGVWVLIPEKDLPDSRYKADRQQLDELKKFPDYRTAKTLELVAAMVMNDFQSGERIYSNYHGRCEERSTPCSRVYAGFFDALGLLVFALDDNSRGGDLGRAIVRNL